MRRSIVPQDAQRVISIACVHLQAGPACIGDVGYKEGCDCQSPSCGNAIKASFSKACAQSIYDTFCEASGWWDKQNKVNIRPFYAHLFNDCAGYNIQCTKPVRITLRHVANCVCMSTPSREHTAQSHAHADPVSACAASACMCSLHC